MFHLYEESFHYVLTVFRGVPIVFAHGGDFVSFGESSKSSTEPFGSTAVKVRNYAELLAEKLQDDGDAASAQRLRKIMNGHSMPLHPKRLHQDVAATSGRRKPFPLLQHVPRSDATRLLRPSEAQRDFVEDYLSVVRSKASAWTGKESNKGRISCCLALRVAARLSSLRTSRRKSDCPLRRRDWMD
jgi:hypothetical protein